MVRREEGCEVAAEFGVGGCGHVDGGRNRAGDGAGAVGTGFRDHPRVRRRCLASLSVSAIDLLSHLSGVPWMSSIEIRDGPLGLLGGAFHVPVSTGITTRNAFLTAARRV
jgi:hypothetical protein